MNTREEEKNTVIIEHLIPLKKNPCFRKANVILKSMGEVIA